MLSIDPSGPGAVATYAMDGALIAPGIDITRQPFTITRGSYDDLVTVGIFAGTVPEVTALVAELNARDADRIHFDGDGYDWESAIAIRSAADVLR